MSDSDKRRIAELEAEIIRLKAIRTLKRGVRVIWNYNLQGSQKAKYSDVIESNDYTAFVNKKVTLVHVMRHGVPHMLVRIPLHGIKYRSLTKLIKEAMYEF